MMRSLLFACFLCAVLGLPTLRNKRHEEGAVFKKYNPQAPQEGDGAMKPSQSTQHSKYCNAVACVLVLTCSYYYTDEHGMRLHARLTW